jgi:hypothetical protein
MKISSKSFSIPSIFIDRFIQSVFRSLRLRRGPWWLAPRALALAAGLAIFLAPRSGQACACGCGGFEVGDLTMFPEGKGWMVTLEYDFQNQNRNWAGTSSAPAADNGDKKIETSFVTFSAQYLFNTTWGIQIELPYAYRNFVTTSDATGKIVNLGWGGLGDMRIKGIYTGLSSDQSIGLTFGLKLPTGSWTHNDANGDIDRDTELGSGSTDLLLGGFVQRKITSDNTWRWFVQAQYDQPMFSQGGYCPGFEIDAAAGIYYNGWSVGKTMIKPIAQVVYSHRASDSGGNASNPVASGYDRILVSPGFEIDVKRFSFNGRVGIPVYERVTGNQVVARALISASVSYKF